MAQKKPGEVEAFLSRPDFSYPVILLYGPDPGLVSERSEKVAELSGVDRSDPFAAVTLAAIPRYGFSTRLVKRSRRPTKFRAFICPKIPAAPAIPTPSSVSMSHILP
mgnify:CR=1 FL=1